MAGEAQLEDSKLEKEHLQAQLTTALQQLDSVRKDMQVCACNPYQSHSGQGVSYTGQVHYRN